MSSKVYVIVFKKSAIKELNGLPQKIQQKILDAVQLLSLNPYTELLQIKKLKGAESLYRVRIQDYRVIYLIENQLIKVTVIKIGHRKEVYECGVRKTVNYDMNKFRLLSKETREVWEKGLVVFPTDKITKNNLFKNIYDNPIIPKDLQDESTKIKTRQEISTLSC